jgi:hypothetical protein
MIATLAALVLGSAFYPTPSLPQREGRPLSRFEGEDVLARIAAKAATEDWARLPIGERMGKIGQELVGTPYVAFTLETDEPVEYCTVNLKGLDCVTFFESCLNMARVLPGGLTKERLIDAVRQTRYRGGKQGDYTTRLHYTTDWFRDNDRKGIVKDLTASLPGAEPFTHGVGFMSSHPNSYKQLKANPGLVPAIAKQEAEINGLHRWYIPTAKIAAIEPLLKTGDIIGLCATQDGIDIAHTGMAYRTEDGVLHFFDATNAPGRMDVKLNKRLSEALSPKHAVGIIVARPL